MKNPIEEMLKIVQAHEMRIDYNFNAMLHVSMLLEYLYDSLEKAGVKIDMEGFEEYQKVKLEEKFKPHMMKLKTIQKHKKNSNKLLNSMLLLIPISI